MPKRDIGRNDARQSKIPFETKKASKSAPTTDGSPPPPEPQEEDWKALLLNMQRSLTSIDAKIDNMNTRMDSVVGKLEDHDSRIKEAEKRISTLEDGATSSARQVTQMDRLLRIIAEKNEDLEARSRRNNVRILGLAETTNTGKMEVFVENLVTELFGKEAFSSHLIVERAHRSLTARPPPGAQPRPIIARFLNYRDRDAVLRRARELGAVKYGNANLSFFPDFTPSVQEGRRKFAGVKKKLQTQEIPYAMLYPAKLKITLQGKQHLFQNPQQVEDFLKHLGKEQAKEDSDRRRSRSLSPMSQQD